MNPTKTYRIAIWLLWLISLVCGNLYAGSLQIAVPVIEQGQTFVLAEDIFSATVDRTDQRSTISQELSLSHSQKSAYAGEGIAYTLLRADNINKGGITNVDDLKSWAKNSGLNLTDDEIKGVYNLFEENATLSQKALLSTKEIVSATKLDDLATKLNLPINPTAQSLTPYQARAWYSWRKSKISELIDKSSGLEKAARQAVDMRNSIRTEARRAMKDTDIADFLMSNEQNITFGALYLKKQDELIEQSVNGVVNETDIYKSMIESSMKGREGIDMLFKMPK